MQQYLVIMALIGFVYPLYVAVFSPEMFKLDNFIWHSLILIAVWPLTSAILIGMRLRNYAADVKEGMSRFE